MATTSSQIDAAPGTFQADAVAALSEVRQAFSRVVEHTCPGANSVSAIATGFGVHRKLAWSLLKVVYSEDPFIAAKHMPPEKSVESWLAAASREGVPEEMLTACRRASDQLASLVEIHASSRTEFEMMLETCAEEPEEGTDNKWRQQAYLSNAYTWGAHCRVLMAFCVLMPSQDIPNFFHAVQVRGLIGFRQSRPGVRWGVNESVVADDKAHTVSQIERVPLDPEAAKLHDGVPVIPKFCSTPMPKLLRRDRPGGMVLDEFASGPVGQAGERTLVTGEIVKNIGAVHATDTDRIAHFGSSVRVPAESLHFDLLVKAGLFGDVQRELCVFSDLLGGVNFDDADALQTTCKISNLGRGLGLAQTPDIPGYSDITKDICKTLGIDPQDYELFRIRMPYPPMPTTVMFRHPLLDPEHIV